MVVPPTPRSIQPAHHKKPPQSALPSDDAVSSTPSPPNEACPEAEAGTIAGLMTWLLEPVSAAHAQHDEELALFVRVQIGESFFFSFLHRSSSRCPPRAPHSCLPPRSCIQPPRHQRLSWVCDRDADVGDTASPMPPSAPQTKARS